MRLEATQKERDRDGRRMRNYRNPAVILFRLRFHERRPQTRRVTFEVMPMPARLKVDGKPLTSELTLLPSTR